MERLTIRPEQAEVALRALYAVATADGDLEPHERSFLTAAANALHVPVPEERAATPDEVAALVPDPVARLRVVQALEVMTLLDGYVSPAEVALVERFAAALGVTDPRLGNLRQLLSGRLRLLQLDLLRRSPMARMGEEVWRRKGLGALWNFFAAPQGYAHDPDRAWRYKQLGLLPEGTLGRTYWAHMTVRRFPFPGEHEGLPEELVRHDLSHVLSGYDTDVGGECENAAFLAGCLREDPFSYVFMVLVHCHLDIEVFPKDPSKAAWGFDPARVVPALERGLRVTRDLYDLSWDFWQDLPRPIAEVRAELGIT